MRPSALIIKQSVALTALLVSGAGWAGGDHVGGHEHGKQETAIGKPGVSGKVDRTIVVEMRDTMRYSPSDIRVQQGETIRLVVKNVGKVKHEFSLGTSKELLQHLEQMKKFPAMEHREPSKLSLAPGKQGEIVWQFTRAGSVAFACLMPGHYEAGMRGAVEVTKW